MPSQKRSRKGQVVGEVAVYGGGPMAGAMAAAQGGAVKAELETAPSFMPGTPKGKHIRRPVPNPRPPVPVIRSIPEEDDDDLDDGEGERERGGGREGEIGDLKRPRLSPEQVRSLERSFADENKLEPERKRLLARQLGLRPRQVAVWFQNRRVRWKTKQMEKDYGGLKGDFDALIVDYDMVRADYNLLKVDYEDLLHENAQLCAQLTHLNEKLLAMEDGTSPARAMSAEEEAPELAMEGERAGEPTTTIGGRCQASQGNDTCQATEKPEEASCQLPEQTFAHGEGGDLGMREDREGGSPTSSGSGVTDGNSSQKRDGGATSRPALRGSVSMEIDSQAEALPPLPPLMELPETPGTEDSGLWGSLSSSSLSMFADEMCDNMELLGDLGCAPWWERESREA